MVPPHYDLINRIFTFGRDKSWRRRAAGHCLVGRTDHILDVCCGTGDLAYELYRLAGTGKTICGLDYSREMLTIAEAKHALTSVDLVQGDAAALPFTDAQFDAIGISFAFRNLTYQNPEKESYLVEILRVLKPGGRFVIVESSQPANRLIRTAGHLYLRLIVKNIGALISGNRHAYTYLAESARRFYNKEALSNILLAAGFTGVTSKPLLFGACAIHIAIK